MDVTERFFAGTAQHQERLRRTEHDLKAAMADLSSLRASVEAAEREAQRNQAGFFELPLRFQAEPKPLSGPKQNIA